MSNHLKRTPWRNQKHLQKTTQISEVTSKDDSVQIKYAKVNLVGYSSLLLYLLLWLLAVVLISLPTEVYRDLEREIYRWSLVWQHLSFPSWFSRMRVEQTFSFSSDNGNGNKLNKLTPKRRASLYSEMQKYKYQGDQAFAIFIIIICTTISILLSGAMLFGIRSESRKVIQWWNSRRFASSYPWHCFFSLLAGFYST